MSATGRDSRLPVNGFPNGVSADAREPSREPGVSSRRRVP